MKSWYVQPEQVADIMQLVQVVVYSSFIQASGKRGKRPGINITKNTLGL